MPVGSYTCRRTRPRTKPGSTDNLFICCQVLCPFLPITAGSLLPDGRYTVFCSLVLLTEWMLECENYIIYPSENPPVVPLFVFRKWTFSFTFIISYRITTSCFLFLNMIYCPPPTWFGFVVCVHVRTDLCSLSIRDSLLPPSSVCTSCHHPGAAGGGTITPLLCSLLHQWQSSTARASHSMFYS